ncbi:glycosyltransferase family 39 protein [Gordonia sp. TBRC 11910]|uniref:Glycosyltransferase family 39 protein n=1 Tax=Gordonia asplenii TaxID=2725283 RepID=A0A848KU95_9ACTN|nr:glycosyltransferase family 39 protein [Gordonia asplenii]NMO02090.1 glycosyltransferase family 39 protein [Gordonia asplenii]
MTTLMTRSQPAGGGRHALDDSAEPTSVARRRRPEPRHWALASLLILTAVLYLWNLSRNGWGNDFYAAASQSGGMSWKALLFGSLDPANSITVDKPPAATWVSGLSVRIFGLSSWSILVPQALMGIGAVALVYATVRRILLKAGTEQTATAGALIAGGVLALTPAAVLIFRFNNPDALLVLLMTAAAYFTVRACQAASWKWLALCGVALGFAFLTKMLQGLLVLPGFGLAYLLFARASWLTRARDLAIATVSLVVSAGWYVLLVELWPAGSRPYIGGSTNNSFLDLVFGYNGVARILGNSGSGGGGGHGGPGGNGASGTSFGGSTGLNRLFSNEFGNEISWLLPAALLVLVAGIALAIRRRLDRDIAIGLTVFGTWLVITGVVFSYMSGTVHPYYTVALAPAIAALVGIGAVIGWRNRESWYGTAFLGALVVAATGWGAIRAYQAGFGWPVLGWVLGALAVIAVAGLVVGRGWTGKQAAGLAAALLIAGGTATATFGVATANTTHTGSIPTAVVTSKGSSGFGGMGGMGQGGGPGAGGQGTPGTGGQGTPGAGGQGTPGGQNGAPTGFTGRTSTADGQRNHVRGQGGPGGGSANTQVVSLLKSTSTTWAAATEGAQSAAPLQLNSGKAVMAIGGFTGDPSPTLTQFKKLVAEGKITYYIAGGGGGPQRSSDISSWVQEHFTATTVGGTTVYKLTT